MNVHLREIHLPQTFSSKTPEISLYFLQNLHSSPLTTAMQQLSNPRAKGLARITFKRTSPPWHFIKFSSLFSVGHFRTIVWHLYLLTFGQYSLCYEFNEHIPYEITRKKKIGLKLLPINNLLYGLV